MRRRGRPVRLRGVLVGLAATAVVAVLESAGALRDFELWLLDQRFLHCNRLPPSDRIVHIDITDDSIDRLGDWPWPRRHHADLVRTLTELGARYVVFDIEFDESADPRLPAETEGPGAVYTREDLIDDDAELAAAIREAGNVFLPVSFRIAAPRERLEERRRRAAEVLRRRPDIDGPSFAAALGLPAEQGPEALLRARVAAALRQEFGLSSAELSAGLGIAREQIERHLAGVKRDVARELAAGHLSPLPCESLSAIISDPQVELGKFVATLRGASPAMDRLDADDLRRAFERALAERIVLCACEPQPDHAARLPAAEGLKPPRYELAAEAAGFGFVAFDADSDGIARRTPLFVHRGGRLIPQLGLAVGRKLLGGDGSWKDFPLDEEGKMVIVWQTPPGRWDSPVNNFRHLPVTRVLEIPQSRRQMEDNEKELGLMRGLLVKEFAAPEEYNHYVELVRRLNLARRDDLAAELSDLKEQLRAIEQKYLELLKLSWSPDAPPAPQDEAERRTFQRYDELYKALLLGELRSKIDRHNQALGAHVSDRLAELRPLIKDRVCLIGYTATALADMKPTAIFSPLAPGAVVHSNVINQTLAGRSIRPPKRWEGLLVLTALGLLISMVTAFSGPYPSAAVMLGTEAAYAGINGFALFAGLGVWMAAAGPMAAIAVSWAAVTMYRQLTEERKKRQFASALSQYVSRAVARRIADDMLDLNPVAGEVTCFFSDIKGFTSISERLGPAGTRDLLNPYLEAMSAVLQRQGAFINKFIGDGIFAFFNPPIWPCPDHAAAACRSALDCQEALRRLNDRLRGDGRAFEALHMRIGISTGPVFVGDYGSEDKRDYTCIGDTVNLGSRLEAANKAFASSIMVADSTHQLVEGQFEFRYLGRLQVAGKTRAVGVYELLGRRGEVSGGLAETVRLFEAGIAAFERGDWDRAEEALEAYRSARPGDPGAARYLELIAAYRREAPPPDWDRALVLTEK